MQHGGDIYTDGLLKGRELIDFSSNINPLGIPESFRLNIGQAVDKLDVYPDIQYRQSKNYICKYLNEQGKSNFGVDDLVLGNGAGEIIDISIASLESICIVVPSFVEYEISAKKHNLHIIYSYLNEDMEVQYDDVYNKIKKVDGLIIANPNNPNGNTIDKKKFKPIVEYCQINNKRIIIDEAFIEFTGSKKDSFIDMAKDYPSICVIRALTKYYGMPGIRFGYGICKDINYNKRMRSKQIPWNINTFAQLALKYVLEDKEYAYNTRKWINEEREVFINELKNLKLIDRVYSSKANFVLIKLRNIKAEDLHDKLLKDGFLIRVCNNFKGLGNNFVRFAIKGKEDNIKLIEKLKRYDILGI